MLERGTTYLIASEPPAAEPSSSPPLALLEPLADPLAEPEPRLASWGFLEGG